MILDEVYQFLNDAGRAPNHATFSTDYLGHSARYYDYLRCSRTPPSLRSLLKAAMRLTDIAHETAGELDDTAAGRLAKRVMSMALIGATENTASAHPERQPVSSNGAAVLFASV